MNTKWWNWLSWWSWLWALAAAELFWLLPIILLVIALSAMRHRRHQRVSWHTTRRIQDQAATPDHGAGVTGALRWMILGDGMTRSLRWRLAREQHLIAGLGGRLATVEMRLVELAPALDELRQSSGDLGASAATVSPEMAAKLYVGLYLGDCAVAAGILMANNAQLPLVLAAVTSLAIATCQFAVGKMVGKALTEREGKQSPLIGPLLVLAFLGVSLAALLHHLSWAWMFLSVTPALGAAALTVASHDPTRQRYHRAKSRMRAPRRRALRAFRSLGRGIGRASGAWTQAAALTTSGILAPQMAEAAAAHVIVAGADLTSQVRGIDSMLHDLELLRLTGGFDETTGRMSALLDQLRGITAVHLGGYQQPLKPAAPTTPEDRTLAAPDHRPAAVAVSRTIIETTPRELQTLADALTTAHFPGEVSTNATVPAGSRTNGVAR